MVYKRHGLYFQRTERMDNYYKQYGLNMTEKTLFVSVKTNKLMVENGVSKSYKQRKSRYLCRLGMCTGVSSACLRVELSV